MSADFTPQELHQLRTAFNLFDKDGDGGISRLELNDVLASFGLRLDGAALGVLFDDSDVNSDGRLSFREFTRVVGELDTTRTDHRALHEALRIILRIQGG